MSEIEIVLKAAGEFALFVLVLLGVVVAVCILAIRDRNEALLECRLLHSRIEALEKTKGLVIPKCEWSICARHNRAYWTEEGCLSCRIEALERALTQASAGLASAGQTLSNLAHGDLTGDQKQIALNAAANAAHAVVAAEAALRGGEET